jgi:hypothetical protein
LNLHYQRGGYRLDTDEERVLKAKELKAEELKRKELKS